MMARNEFRLAVLVTVPFIASPLHAQTVSGAPVQITLPAAPVPGDRGQHTGYESETDIAKKLQNPVGDLILSPLQNNINFNAGPHKGTQDILNVQPIIPVHLNQDWNLITRTILPLVWSPSNQPGPSVPFGLGSTSFTAFLSPRTPVNGWLWGAGPIIQVPTATNRTLGSPIWGLGPAVVVVKLAGPIVAGGLMNNVFSLGGTTGRAHTRYRLLTFNPFFNYNFGEGWFVGSAPIVTANWDAPGSKWTVPVGAQVGRVIKFGTWPVYLVLGAYYNAVRPAFGPTWQLRTQAAIVF
jgi:hypothetical protein